ncbi:MAG: hypothetical protein GEU74_11485 [Nitriliruptorales bacterium]|nr:hypothetical protein [Nitriliruptorales bacterium]
MPAMVPPRSPSRKVAARGHVEILASAAIAFAHPDAWDDGVVDSGKEVHGHQHDQHGGDEGHLPGSSKNVELVSQLKLKNVVPEKIADVSVYKNYAYLAAWGVVTCKANGVHVVDIHDVNSPREVAFIPSKEGSYPGEGVQALTIDTPAFSGDILVTNNEKCNDNAGFGGMNIYNVTNPKAPTPLYEGFGDDVVPGTGKMDAHEIHSVFAWDAGSKAYAVMVDNEEQRDVDIVDITNPRKPKMVVEYDMVADFPEANLTQKGMENEVWLHDMVVKQINGRQIMLLSYWDAGYIQLDVTDPANATVVADSDYAAVDPLAKERGLRVPPEGNGHQAEFTRNNDYVIATDEDFDPYKLSALDDEGEPFAGTIGIGFEPGTTLPNDLVFVGEACTAASVPAASTSDDQIALVERGTCTFTAKVTTVEAKGYDAMIVFNSENGDPPCQGLVNMLIDGNIPSFFVGRDTGFDLMDQEYDDAVCNDPAASQPVAAAVGTVFRDAVSISSYFDGWGYVHLFDGKTMKSLDTYGIPEAHDPEHASGSGDLSVHEVATSTVDDTLAYYAYYAGGFRVTRIKNRQLVEVGHYIDPDGNNFWGIEAFTRDGVEYAAASDRDHGLWIFRYTGTE